MAAGLPGDAGLAGESRRGGRGALRLKRGVRLLSRKSLIVEDSIRAASKSRAQDAGTAARATLERKFQSRLEMFRLERDSWR